MLSLLLLRAAALVGALAGLATSTPVSAQQPATKSAAKPAPTATVAQPDDSIRDFAKLIDQLSEAGGFFDTDNLISNERSYLHVMGALDRLKVRGGAYIGVGPDQNFSYIARIKPRIAFIIDIRRDNMLQHLLFKALFAQSRSRLEYLALLLGTEMPSSNANFGNRSIEQLLGLIDASPGTTASRRAARRIVQTEVARMGVTLTVADLATIERFHGEFMAAGLELRFTSVGRPPQWYYPTLRQLLVERDLTGRTASYLANESDFQFLKTMQQRNLVVPVIGDLAGTKAMTAVGQYMTARGLKLSALYASNVEDYVMRGGAFGAYARSVIALPRDARSVIVRSWFGGAGSHPENITGFHTTQLLQTVDDFAADMKATGYLSYRNLVNRHYVPLR